MPSGQAKRTSRVLVAQPQRAIVGLDQLVLALEPFGDELLEHGDVDVEQGGERAHIDHVAVELALPRLGILGCADFGQRHADDGDVAAVHLQGQRPGRIVEEIAAGRERGHVLGEGLRVHRHEQVGAAAGAEPAPLAHPDLVPGRQALDVGREDVARRDRHAHAQDRPREQEVGARGAGAVDVGEPDYEIVRGFDWHDGPAWAISMANFCMSQAPVGQRSAHRPQCRQRSSSLTITRRLFTGSETRIG